MTATATRPRRAGITRREGRDVDVARRNRIRGGLAGVLVGLLVIGAMLVAGQLRQAAADRRADAATAVTSYLAELEPIAKDGGRVVTLGLKAGIRDIDGSRYTDDVLTGMADGWHRELTELRRQLAGLQPPAELADAHRDLEAAFTGYITVAATLSDAARSDGDRRTELTDRAIAQGENADDMFDRGAAAVQTQVADLDLETVPWLPQPQQGENP